MGTYISTMKVAALFGLVFLATGAFGQTPGDAKVNSALKMPIEICQSEGNCQSVSTSVSLDSNWRWIHDSSSTNCYSGNEWDSTLCPDSATCTAGCVLEGADSSDWTSTYGVTSDNSGGITLQFVTVGQYSTNIGSRMLMLLSCHVDSMELSTLWRWKLMVGFITPATRL